MSLIDYYDDYDYYDYFYHYYHHYHHYHHYHYYHFYYHYHHYHHYYHYYHHNHQYHPYHHYYLCYYRQGVLTCSHLFWSAHTASSKDKPIRDKKKVLDCLKKALKIANQCMDTTVQVDL